VSSARRPLLAYGALVLEHLIRKGKPKHVIISAQGVREGVIHDQLPHAERGVDPLIKAAEDYNTLRARDPRHAYDLIEWVEGFMSASHIDESGEERRLRRAACLLADIGWRAHPDYRGEQSLNVIAHAAFIGLDHPSRAYLALAVFYRYAGLKDDPASQRLRELLTPRLLERARLLGALMRVAYLLSAAMQGLLPRMPISCAGRQVTLTVPVELQSLASDRVAGRMKQLAKLIGREPNIVVR
jgi:exopolyphosphatase / guanosine-5'-triphosphate,3'-diphosphate pyrophosphatase